MELCYDPHLHNTLFTKFTVSKGVENRQKTKRGRSSLNKSHFDTGLASPPDIIFNCKNGQLPTLRNILGQENLANQYTKCGKGTKYLAKGHLAAYEDFVYFSQREATMYYVQTTPQWQAANACNWRTLENRIRTYATSSNNDLTVYAGTLRILKLPDVNNNEREIFLATDNNNNPVVPVPELMYRIVYDQNMNRGIAFVLINNVDSGLDVSKYVICQDVCEQVKSLINIPKRKDVAKGYIYCCTLEDFMTSTGLTSFFNSSLINLPLLM